MPRMSSLLRSRLDGSPRRRITGTLAVRRVHYLACSPKNNSLCSRNRPPPFFPLPCPPTLPGAFLYGCALFEGIGMHKPDRKQALKFWHKAARHGHAGASHNLVLLWTTMAEEEEDAAAQFGLGQLYEVN